MAATDTAPRVALLARAGDACERIADALREAGAEVVLVADPMQAVPAQVRQAQPQAVLVALEPAIEDAIERFEDVLADPDYMVIFEEAEQAAQRAGWDAARWLRHLAAKLHRHSDVLPAGAETPDEVQLTDTPLPPPAARVDLDEAIVAFTDEAQQRADTVPPDTLDGLAEAAAPAPGAVAEVDGAWTIDDMPLRLEDIDLGADAPLALEDMDAGGDVPLRLADVDAGEDALAPGIGFELPPAAAPGSDSEYPQAADDGSSGLDMATLDFDSLSLSLSLDAGDDLELEELSFDVERFSRAGQAEDAPAGIEEFLAQAAKAHADAEPGAVPGEAGDVAPVDPAPAPASDPAPARAATGLDFSGLSLVADDEMPAVSVAAPAKPTPSFDLDALGAGLSLVDPDSYGHGKPPGLVLIEAGLGGPDAVRQLLAALPPAFPRPILIRLPLEGGRYDRLVKQMTRATSAPVGVAEPGERVVAGHIHFVPPGLGLRSAGAGWVFDAAQPLDAGALLPAGDSAVLFLSGADCALVSTVCAGGWNGLVLAQTPDQGCYDPAAASAAIEAGATHGNPADLAAMLLDRWPAPGGHPHPDPTGMQ